MFPIKYIDNNLVWNKDNEVFAYYELIPYNYSFLSAEQKFIVHDSFRQLIAQSREGKIHALQIATESSIRSMQEQSKKLVTGKLKEVAYQKIDEQTEALVSMIGDNQVDYRFFLGFKLMVTEEQLNLKNIKKSAWLTFTEFLHEVNHTLMNDFVSMPNDEINRYMKMEKLLENKISRRFKVRRLEINDFGYLMEHLYGRDGIAYEDYEYQLPKKKLNKETLIKYYDLIRPTRCVIEESQRYLRLEHEDKESYVSYFTVNAIVGELDFPSSEIFYFQQQQFTFPVDTSMNVEIVENRKALTTVRNKKKELKDLDNHAYQAGSETSSNVVDALDSVDELETDLDQSKESMYKLSYVIRMSAPDLDELKRRCDEVKDFYDDLNVKLVRPAGDMLGLHSEFLPASKRYINDYVQYVKSDFLAGLGFGATQQLGETTGIYMGYSVDTGRNVYLQPSLASQGVKGTVTNALASAFVGSLGGGKSFCNNLLVYYSVLFGGQAVILDPKSERGNWKETLPEIAHEINIVNLTSDKDNAGLLDPFVIMKNVKDAESLAIDILTFLTGISSRDGEKFPVLRKAVRSVTQSDNRGLLHVIDELRREDTPIARNIADHIDSFTDYDFAHLLFSDGTVENAISLDNQLNIIQVADLVLPDKDTTFEEYTTIELLSVSMLIVISTFALDFIHSDRSIFKIVDLDEAWAFLNVAQGETLSNKLVRAGRAMQAGVYFVTQSSGDVSKESLKNNIGLKFAFRSTDINEIKQTLEFFGIDKDDENNQNGYHEYHFENGEDMDDILKNIFGGGFKKSKSSGGFGSSGFGGSGFHGSGFGGFGSNGTGGFGGSYSSKGEDLHAEVTVSFDEAAFGGKKVIRLQSSNGGVQNYEVNIPAGIESGKSIRLKGKGYPGVGGGEAGDLLLKVNVQDKPGYKREGRDVYTTVNIPFTTAVFGGEAKVHTIYGDVLCNIKPGTQSGTKIRLRGKGIVAMNNPSVHGDEYATVQIEVPTNLTPEARRKLKEFEQECNGSRRSRGFGSGSAA